ncbi:MAG: acyl carrier protein [Rhizobacter sp.]|nr:acyl carrier protein [Chlorobiales bacterium]
MATTEAEVRPEVHRIIIDKMGVSPEQLTDQASFTNDLGADSLDTVELIMEFENKFQIQIPDEDAERIATIKDAIDYIVAKKNA